MTLPVCWCGDPATYALELEGPALVGDSEPRHWWLRLERDALLVVPRCRPHAGPLAHEVTEGHLVEVEPFLTVEW